MPPLNATGRRGVMTRCSPDPQTWLWGCSQKGGCALSAAVLVELSCGSWGLALLAVPKGQVNCSQAEVQAHLDKWRAQTALDYNACLTEIKWVSAGPERGGLSDLSAFKTGSPDILPRMLFIQGCGHKRTLLIFPGCNSCVSHPGGVFGGARE